ncbi:hypothetical protein FA13DRAFT_1519108 [Coprinellus micaceus]|uniref:Uncharacterized protein n=1 Tax=Coprinellus micaceus TaxID=71717 RepID=A0A4Y7SKJ9_COPMI|nr:hypothetical protein FA13DRAFT_1519108 [Coprinellus micaceus]
MDASEPSKEPPLFHEEVLRERNFHEDFRQTLASCRSEFAGTFCYASSDARAPNPSIKIPIDDGSSVQTVKLPWSWPKTRTPTDDDELDYRKIYSEALAVSFLNPMWEVYVEEKAREVARALGIPPYFPKLRCEFSSLIFHNPRSGGFKIPQNGDPGESNTTIASMLVVLPSAFEGGELHCRYSGQTRVLDASQGSEYNTSILAWSNGVVIEAKPFTSGSPLVLSYRLGYIPDPNTPLPSPPRVFRCQAEVEQCFIAWKEGHFWKTLPGLPILVYVLSFKYGAEDLRRGLDGLKDSDANVASHAICAAGRAGFRVCLGGVTKSVKTYKISGKRHWPWNMGFKYLEEESKGWDRKDMYQITNVVCVDGGEDGLFDDGVEVEEGNVVPKGAFDGSQHDNLEHDRRFSTYYGDKRILEQHQRSALILLREEDQILLGVALNGYEWALRKVDALTAKYGYNDMAEMVVASLLERLTEFKRNSAKNYNELPAFDDNASNTLTRELGAYAIKWRLPALWNDVISHCNPSLEATVNSASLAVTTFELEMIKPGLSQLLKRMPTMCDRTSLITAMASRSQGTEGDWVGHLRVEALASYRKPVLEDIPTLVNIFLGQGLNSHESNCLDRILSSGSYEFLVNLAKALRSHRSSQPPLVDEEKARLDAIERRCLQAAFPLWKKFARSEYNNDDIAKKRIHALANYCLVELSDIHLCLALANVVQEGATYDIHTTLADALHQDLSRAASSSLDTWGPEKVLKLQQIVVECLSAAARQADWKKPSVSVAQANIDQFVRLSLDAGKPELCYPFLDSMQTASYWTHHSLELSLLAQSKKIPRLNATTGALYDIRRSIVDRTITKWDDEPMFQLRYVKGTQRTLNIWIGRVYYIMTWTLNFKEPDLCVSLLNSVLKIPSNPECKSWHSAFYLPLISGATQFLRTKDKTAVTAEPFKTFFRLALSVYLARVLGPKTPDILPSEAPKRTVDVGCGKCANCRQLQAWVNKLDKEPFRVSARQEVRTHVERQISSAEIDDIVSMETVRERSPYTLVVTKTHEIVARMDWSSTQSDARAYLQCFGFNEEELEVVMGERYQDVSKAIEGEKVFELTESLVIPPGATKGSTLFSASATPSPTSESNAVAVAGKPPMPKKPAASQKRKCTHEDSI